MDTAKYLEEIKATLGALETIIEIQAAARLIMETWKAGGRVYTFGNGGSAATASHFAADLRKYVKNPDGVIPELRKGVKAYCLSDNVSFLTAVANDIDYRRVFLEALRVEGVGEGDLLFGISCSGESDNVLLAMTRFVESGAGLIVLTGQEEGTLGLWARTQVPKRKALAIITPHPDIRGQEDLHMIVCHAIVGELWELARKSDEGAVS